MSDAQGGLWLASRSPRRRELLSQLGIPFRVVDVEVDERPRRAEVPEAYVRRIARDKAGTARANLPAHALVLAADTTVVVGGDILGKPADRDAALAMLASLSGREHRVYSGVALAGARSRVRVSESVVHFRKLTRAERIAYVATGEPMDKAGAYAIQGRAAVFVEHLEGSYSGVMGLPLYETALLLRDAGIHVLA